MASRKRKATPPEPTFEDDKTALHLSRGKVFCTKTKSSSDYCSCTPREESHLLKIIGDKLNVTEIASLQCLFKESIPQSLLCPYSDGCSLMQTIFDLKGTEGVEQALTSIRRSSLLQQFKSGSVDSKFPDRNFRMRQLLKVVGDELSFTDVSSLLLLFYGVIPRAKLDQCNDGHSLLQTIYDSEGEEGVLCALQSNSNVLLLEKFRSGLSRLPPKENFTHELCHVTYVSKGILYNRQLNRTQIVFGAFLKVNVGKWFEIIHSLFLKKSECPRVKLCGEVSISSRFVEVGVALQKQFSLSDRRLFTFLIRQVVDLEYKSNKLRGVSRSQKIMSVIKMLPDEERLIQMAKLIHFSGDDANQCSNEKQIFYKLLVECHRKQEEHQKENFWQFDIEKQRLYALVCDALGFLYGKHPCLAQNEILENKLRYHKEANSVRRPLLKAKCSIEQRLLLLMDSWASLQSQGCSQSLIASSLDMSDIQSKCDRYSKANDLHSEAMKQLESLFASLGLSDEDRVLSPSWIAVLFDLMLREFRLNQSRQLLPNGKVNSEALACRILGSMERIKQYFGCMTTKKFIKSNLDRLESDMKENGKKLVHQAYTLETIGFILDSSFMYE